MHWMDAREGVPLIRTLRDQVDAARQQEFERAARMLARGDDPAAVLEAFSRGLTNKLLHGPTQALNDARGDERSALAELLVRLFRIRP